MTNDSGLTPLRQRGAAGGVSGDVATYCARPGCQQEFRRAIQPGHPQLYCSETCRRKAQQEARRIRSRLRDLEATVAQQRRLLAAYGVEDESAAGPDEVLSIATRALDRASGAIRFLAKDDSLVAEEFRALHTAITPLVELARGVGDGSLPAR